MKAKRFLGILLAVIMMLSCFAVSASADETYTLNIYLYETNDSTKINLRDDTNMADSNVPEGSTPVNDVSFKVYKVADDSTSTTPPSGDPTQTITTSGGVAQFTTTTAGRYLVVPDEDTLPTYANGEEGQALIVSFLVDLPRTNDDGTARENTVNVYPKMLVTGAIQLTKTFNGAAPTGDESATFEVTGPNGFKETVVLNAANGGVWQKDGLAFGEYTAVEQSVTDPYVINANQIIFNVTKGGAFGAKQEEIGTVEKGSLNNISSTKPFVSKEVKSSTGTTYGSSANIDSYNNAVADWKITTVLPQDIKKYTRFELKDEVDEKLVYSEATPVTVKLGGVDMSKDLYDLGQTGRKITVSLKDFDNQTPNGTLTIEFSTAIDTSKAENIGVTIPNHVVLDYTNANSENGSVNNNTPENPQDPENPEDPDDPGRRPDPVVWTGKIDILKYCVGAKGEDEPLSGVEFTLTSVANGSTIQNSGKVVTDDEGKITLTGLLDGTYTLTETKAKPGFELIGRTIEIVVSEGKVTSEFEGDSLVSIDNGLIKIKNIPSTNLPLTGGMGTTLFAGFGLALAAVGGVLFFKKSKKAKAC